MFLTFYEEWMGVGELNGRNGREGGLGFVCIIKKIGCFLFEIIKEVNF